MAGMAKHRSGSKRDEEVITVDFTPEEYETLEAIAAVQGVTVEALVRGYVEDFLRDQRRAARAKRVAPGVH